MLGLTNPELGVAMLGLFVVLIMFGFPIAFTLMALGVFFGYWAMGDLVWPLLVQRTYSVMTNDVLDLHPALRLHGLHHRAGEHPRPAVPFLAACSGPDAGRARHCDTGHLRHLRDRHRHCRRGGDVDGPSRPARHAPRRLRYQTVRGRDLRRGVSRHPDSAQRHADPLRRNSRRICRQALCRRLFPRPYAGEPVHPLYDDHVAAQSVAGAEVADRGTERAVP